MRIITVVLALVLYFIITLPLLIIFAIIRLFDDKLCSRLAQPVVACGMRSILLGAGAKLHISGVENIPMDEPVLFAGNHRGFFDIVLAYWAIPFGKLTGFIAKKELKKAPMLNFWMMLINCKFLDRKDPKKGLETIQSAIEDIKAGRSIFIMPEGTRSKTRDMLPFKPGSLKIAERTNCKVVPVAIWGTDEVFENHLPWIHSEHIYIRFGTPIATAELGRDEKKALPGQVQEVIATMLDELRPQE